MTKFIHSPLGEYFNVDHIVTFYPVDYENSFCIYIDAVNGEDYIFDQFNTSLERDEAFYDLMKTFNVTNHDKGDASIDSYNQLCTEEQIEERYREFGLKLLDVIRKNWEIKE